MKKQINHSVKAHLLRSALILLSLVAFNRDIFCQTPTPTATAATCRPTPGLQSYEAESDVNTLQGSAIVLSCPTCSGGLKVGYVGSNDGTLQFNAVGVVATGNYTVTICYLNGDAVRYATSERERRSRNASQLSVHWLVSDCGVNTDNRHFEHRLQHA